MPTPSAPLYNKVPVGQLNQPDGYDVCPSCGGVKKKQAKRCQNCRDKIRGKTPEIQQPLDPSYRLIPLTKGQVTKVDTSDYEWLMQWKWCARWSGKTNSFYAMRVTPRENGKRKIIHMHREIIGLSNDNPLEVDHAFRDTLDNRKIIHDKENLRPATSSQNKWNRPAPLSNTSGHKGVWLDKRYMTWQARIGVNGKTIHLGSFSDINQAIKARDEATLKYHKEFAHL